MTPSRLQIVAALAVTALTMLHCGTPGAAETPAHDSYWREKSSLYETIKTIAAVVMIGDSLTDGAEWHELFPHVDIVNRGIDGDTTAGVLERMNGIASVKPNRAFIMLGVNDFISTKLPVDAVFDNYRKIVAAMEQQGTSVVIQSTLLCNPGKANWIACRDVNEKVKRLNLKLSALTSKNVSYIDLNKTLADAGGLNSAFTYDGVHLNGSGYLRWRDAIAPFMPTGHPR